MVKFLAAWIIFQLVLLGYIVGSIQYAASQWTYKCSDGEMTLGEVRAFLLVLPLIIYVDSWEIDDYCKRQRAEK